MHAAQVTEWGKAPKFVSVDNPEAPADDSVVQIRVQAAAIHNLVRGRAAGTHYTANSLPHTPGVDGAGINVATGEKVFFSTFPLGPSPGSFAEVVNVRKASVYPLPDGVEPIMAAALVNPVMSSWLALKYRADLEEGWEAMIIGATTASGKLAIRIARQLGAKKVFGAARRESELKELDLDGYAVLNGDDPAKTDFSATKSATVVLDYLWGPWPAAYLQSTGEAGAKTPVQYISIGNLTGEKSEILAGSLKSRPVILKGAGPGAWNPAAMNTETPAMLQVLKGLKEEENPKLVKRWKMADVEEAWTAKGGARTVLVIDE